MAGSAMANTPYRALVHGAGPTGSLSALALAAAGWQVTLTDPLDAEQICSRQRAYAFSHASRRLLEQLDLWGALQEVMVPFRRLLLCDQAVGAAVPFGLGDLAPSLRRGAGAAVGWVGLHRPLMELLLARLQAHPAVCLQLGSGLEPAACLEAEAGREAPDLVVAADGPHSPHREALGIGVWQHTYRQSCLTAQVALRGAAADEAWELFRPEGPFAVLPLAAGQAQMVWSAASGRCRRLESLGSNAFLDVLAASLPANLQPDALLDQPRAFPVGLLLARRLSSGTTLLVGESAHRCHPVGGQGLNLCWRDVAVLHRLARRATAGRLRPERLPAAYGRRRWPDLLLTLAATDLLMRLFSNRARLLLPLRRLGLAGLASLAPLRRLSLGAMTHGPCQPW
ncbi:FAD-dependent monooxygenase [Cyanobium sp. LEGE 06143]|uniref:FAD-dependent monooxygenase n=1 Tax=Cyanobium sp. LEGE 06143 TaxID=945727 RepID=UPI001880FD03|nr:FAD-dependent monooxygenase [Cyanobium sp. LEGE 06143]MBE9171984.1 FAD-dependent monooxygenase [Cyanobium sp. LEGE 06143]